LKRRAFLEEFHEKQEQVKEWLQNLGIGEHIPVVHDDDEADDVHVPSQHDEHSVKNRNVPSSAVLPVIRPALGRQQSVSDRAKVAMQEYLNHFLGNMEIVNSREVPKSLYFLYTLVIFVLVIMSIHHQKHRICQLGYISVVLPSFGL
jgi:phospholipase D1/2